MSIDILVLHGLMSSKNYKEATLERRFNMLEELCNKDKRDNKEWMKKWHMSVPLVKKLVTMEYQTTKLLGIKTDTFTSPSYEEYVKMESVKHTPELVTQLLAIYTIWGNPNGTDMKTTGRISCWYKDKRDRFSEAELLFFREHPQYIIEENARNHEEELLFYEICTGITSNNLPDTNACYTKSELIEAIVY